MTSEELTNICNRMSEGKSLRSVCRDLGMNEATVRYWLNKDEAAFTHSQRARELGCDALADECLEIADDKEAKPDDKRIRIETRIRLIGKWSQRYSDKFAHEHTGKDGGPIETATKLNVEGLSDEQLRALASIQVPTS